MAFNHIFITGGAGFIGANTADYYLQKGLKVTLFDNLSRPGVEANLTWLKKRFASPQLKIIKGDVRDFNALKQNLKGHQVVFHFAGQTAVTTSVAFPRPDFETNALGAFNVLEAVRSVAPEAVVLYSSTNKVYGSLGRISVAKRKSRYVSLESVSIDESEPLDFYSPYGCSKGTGDQYFKDYHRIYGLNTIVFRQSCIYGIHQFGVEDQGWVAHFAAQAIKHLPLTIFGDGKQVRDLLYITDLIAAYDAAIHHLNLSKGGVYNLGGGLDNTLSLIEVIKMLEKLSGRKLKINYREARLGDQKVYISNIDKAKRDFNWHPRVNVTEGIKLLYFWLSDYLKA